MLSALTFILQLNGIMLGFGSNVIALLAGKFEAEFLRVAIKASVAMFTFYADQHWVIRFLALITNCLLIMLMEYYYLRESLMQTACY